VAAAIAALRRDNPASSFALGMETLDKLLGNIVRKPMEEKYRSLKVSNPAFQRRLGALRGADALMLACGFVRETVSEEEHYVMHASAEGWPKLLETKSIVAASVEPAAAAGAAAPAPLSTAAGPAAAAQPDFSASDYLQRVLRVRFPFPRRRGGSIALLSFPPRRTFAFLTARAARPFVPYPAFKPQENPTFANNPNMRQLLDRATGLLAANPEWARSLLEAEISGINVTEARARAEQMRQLQGAFGGSAAPLAPSGHQGSGANQPRASLPQPPQQQHPPQQQRPSNGRSDEDLTEEEMIAEAIRRSLQDGS
jgi:hypothetical protein